MMKRRVEVEVSIAPEAERKIWCWVVASDVEISGLGAVESAGPTILIPDLVCLPAQTGSLGHTELDDDAVAELQVQYARAGRRLGFHFHSHCRMEAFFSALDNWNFERLVKFGTPFVAAVFNVQGHVRWRVQTAQGFLTEWNSVIEGDEPSKAELAQAALDVKQAVRERRWTNYWDEWKDAGIGFKKRGKTRQGQMFRYDV